MFWYDAFDALTPDVANRFGSLVRSLRRLVAWSSSSAFARFCAAVRSCSVVTISESFMLVLSRLDAFGRANGGSADVASSPDDAMSVAALPLTSRRVRLCTAGEGAREGGSEAGRVSVASRPRCT
eukprot:6301509-Prymnesium_polylepis.1